MAVPFSRPAYPGGSRRRSQQQRAQQTQQPQTTSQRQITRFLDGQGGIRLDQLSLTSRIAFYALYEAYRLLMDLTQPQSQQSHNRTQPQQQQQQQSQQSQQHTVLNGNVPEERPVAPQVYHPLPDIVESTRSYPRDFVGINDNDKCQSVQPDIVQDTFDNTNDSNQDETDRAYQVPDVISRIGNNSPNDQYHHRDFVFKTNSNYHFKSQRSVSVSSDYFSLDGLSTVDEEEATEDDFDKFDDSKDHDLDLDKDLVYKNGPNGINWQNLGKQLCEIASAFEVTYAPPVNEHHRELYEVYRDLKLKTLTLSRTDTSVTGLAKTVLRQVLLSSIWILIKKIT